MCIGVDQNTPFVKATIPLTGQRHDAIISIVWIGGPTDKWNQYCLNQAMKIKLPKQVFSHLTVIINIINYKELEILGIFIANY